MSSSALAVVRRHLRRPNHVRRHDDTVQDLPSIDILLLLLCARLATKHRGVVARWPIRATIEEVLHRTLPVHVGERKRAGNRRRSGKRCELLAILHRWERPLTLNIAQKTQREYKAKISSQSKKNFVLEKDVRYLDSRIALLIQNRMALEEVTEP